MRTAYATCCTLLLLISCGRATEERKETTTGTASTGTPSNVTVGTLAFELADDATDAINDDASGSGIDLLGADARSFTRAKNCVAADGKAVVAVTFAGTSERTVKRANITATLTITASGKETRTWMPPAGQTLACNAAGTAAKITWQDQSLTTGLVTQVSVDKSRVFTRSVRTPRRALQTASNVSIKGTRTITWSAVTDATAIVRNKSIAVAVTRSGSRTGEDGAKATLQSEVKTLTDAPLLVRVERSLADRSLIQKTIKSGTLSSTQSDGSTVQTTFDSLVYDFSATNEDRCQPVSGKMIGKVFAAGASTPGKTFVITFGDNSVDSGTSVAFDGGAAEDYPEYNAKGCDLEAET
ncbi:MAG: hypothetical protein FJ146_16340 [Deltaproteobacteria bacterium]|nr:hypothetical protein [Deltaproteobacteria bacterium]